MIQVKIAQDGKVMGYMELESKREIDGMTQFQVRLAIVPTKRKVQYLVLHVVSEGVLALVGKAIGKYQELYNRPQDLGSDFTELFGG